MEALKLPLMIQTGQLCIALPLCGTAIIPGEMCPYHYILRTQLIPLEINSINDNISVHKLLFFATCYL